MHSFVIECESCNRLSEIGGAFPEETWGRKNQITCPNCRASIEIDLTGEEPVLTRGRLLRPSRVQLEPADRQGSSSLSPHTIEDEPSGAPSVRSPLSALHRPVPPRLPALPVDAEEQFGVEAASVEAASVEPESHGSARLEVEDADLLPDSAVLSSRADEPSAASEEPRDDLPPLRKEAPHPPRPWELHALKTQHPRDEEGPSDEEPAEALAQRERPGERRATAQEDVMSLPPLQVLGQFEGTHHAGLRPEVVDQETTRRRAWVPLALFAAAGLLVIAVFSQGPQLLSRGAPQGTASQEASASPLAGENESMVQEELPEPEPEPEPERGVSPESGEPPAAAAHRVVARVPAPSRTANVGAERIPGGAEPTTRAVAEATPPSEPGVPAQTGEESEAEVASAFSREAAAQAMDRARLAALGCRSQEDDPYGVAQVTVTFAPSGRVTSASVAGYPFAGTQVGGCIATQFRAARVPAFDGDFVTVTKSVVVQ